MTISSALAKREIAVERKALAASAHARIERLKQDHAQTLMRIKAKAETAIDGWQGAIAINGAARVGGMFLESYAQKHLSPERKKFIGPAAMVGTVACYALGLSSSSQKAQMGYLTLAGGLEGAASRYILSVIDNAMV